MTWQYHAPVVQIMAIYQELLRVDEVLSLPPYQEFSPDLLQAVLDEAEKFASEQLLPINQSGDKTPAVLKDDEVMTSPGFKDAYQAFIANGWNGVPFAPEYGGQGLPWLVSTAVSEMWSTTNMAFALCPLLTQGAIELLSAHGSDEQKEQYLPKMVSGQWTGTMCLTEPQAGSDVGAVATKAIKEGEYYRITGQKIYITYGEHDFTDNIIHMVLARTKEAPAGSKGISLFIVPKFLEDGSRNDVKAVSLEHKLGIHGSPTAVLTFGDDGDGALGYLVGEENQGLKYMFTMMNNARLAVGVEGVAMAEGSLQQAKAYAAERTQGGVAINQYPDVIRMIQGMEGEAVACRVMAYLAAKGIDMMHHHPDQEIKNKQLALVDFLIPMVKAHSTDTGFWSASEAVQIFGGMGYIEETGIAQYLRDARIAMIYEGTNGIQAMDLLARKLVVNDGLAYRAYRDEMQQWIEVASGGKWTLELTSLLEQISGITDNLRQAVSAAPEKAASVAYDYLQMIACFTGCVIHQRVVLLADEKICSKATSHNFLIRTLPKVASNITIIQNILAEL
jgi:alkylation response protein AidB-like acyl-CoA dehydrogenase